MTIYLAYSTSAITSGKKVCRELKMVAILKILKYQTQLQFEMTSDMEKSFQIMPIFFHGDDIFDVTGWPQSFPLYSCLGEGNWLR